MSDDEFNTTDPVISVIIPVYNAHLYLQQCLDSVFNQTFQDFEIIAINDGSTDHSLRILRRNQADHPNLIVVDQENHGQGYTRNRAIELARGEFIFFLDSDDFIEPLTFELTTTRATQDQSDMVHFDWKLSSHQVHRPNYFRYTTPQSYWGTKMLVGADCDLLLDASSYFTMTSLYRTSFLRKNSVSFGEGHIYEDIPFFVRAVNNAERISLIHSPLYVLRPNPTSTTRTNVETDRHYKDHIQAMHTSFEALTARSPRTYLLLAKYHLERFLGYRTARVPKKYRRNYEREFVDAISPYPISTADGVWIDRWLSFCIKFQVFEKKRYSLFHLVVLTQAALVPFAKKRLAALNAGRESLKRKLPRREDKAVLSTSDLHSAPFGTILFLGFDYRYTGNSRYLFEELCNDPRFEDSPIRFVTTDERVPAELRVAPTRENIHSALMRASVVIAESWLSPHLPKHGKAIWVQLWHGIPLKRMLFDSPEKEITGQRWENKVQKYEGILRWDYMLAGSQVGASKFSSAFLFPRTRLLEASYPRVDYLLKARKDTAQIDAIRNKVGLTASQESKKIVLYAPTWRDYNYGLTPTEHDYDYVLDVNQLSEQLGDEYIVLVHDHNFMGSDIDSVNDRCINVSSLETQELLLITDVLVTDYSSVLFDALAIDVQVAIYANDVERFSESRGLYEDIWEDLQPLATDDITETANLIKSGAPDSDIKRLKEKYSYFSDRKMIDIVQELDHFKMKRNW